MTAQAKRRRWFQFRLRTLLTAVLVLSLPLSWFAVRMDRARRQREAVEAIKHIGGEVWYDYQAATDYYWIPICEGDPPPEDWVSVNTYLGRDFFHEVVGVSLYIGGKVPEICPICESDLATLGALKGLRSLDIRSQNVSDRGMKHLAPLAQLELLDASWTGLDDDGTHYLKSMISLRVLGLDGTHVTDIGLVPLQVTVHGLGSSEGPG